MWQRSGGLLECRFRYFDDGFGVLDTGKITINELSCLLSDWNESFKVPSIETSSTLPYPDLALKKCVLAENNSNFVLNLSTFRKKLDIYSYVPGESDHHLCMMQSTIRSELTGLLLTNSSVGSFEREVKFFRLKWTRRGHDGREFHRISKCYPRLAKKALVGGPKNVKERPLVYKDSTPEVCDVFDFEKSSTSMRRLCRDSWNEIAAQLCLAQLLRTSSDENRVSRERGGGGGAS